MQVASEHHRAGRHRAAAGVCGHWATLQQWHPADAAGAAEEGAATVQAASHHWHHQRGHCHAGRGRHITADKTVWLSSRHEILVTDCITMSMFLTSITGHLGDYIKIEFRRKL